MVVGALVGATGDLNWPAYYLIVAGMIGALRPYFLQEPNGRRMWGSAPAAHSDEEARGARHRGRAAAGLGPRPRTAVRAS